MPTLYRYPKDFINDMLIDEIGDLVNRNVLAFALMATGIEFLGKCNDVAHQNRTDGKAVNNLLLHWNFLD